MPYLPREYRPDIDGLRAIAVLGVLIFHAFPALLPGGFTGVDVFFVISGFLISRIIFRELSAGHFTIGYFYTRRIRRIFPALLIILLLCLFAGWFMLLPDEFEQVGKHVLAGASFISNFLNLSEAGYFDAAAEKKPLLHLWSLGVEEQFYIVWPLLLMLVWRFRRLLVPLLVLSFAGSLALSISLSPTHPTAAFYLPVTRVWELSIGGVLAYLSHSSKWGEFSDAPVNHCIGRLGCEAAIAGGLMLIVAGMILTDRRDVFPGWRALIPTTGAAIVIAFAPGSRYVVRLLSNPLAVGVGLISYPLYLVHWPILSFIALVSPGRPPTEWILFALFTSFAAAWLIYQCVELNVRRYKLSPLILLATMVVTAIMALSAYRGLLVSRLTTALPAQFGTLETEFVWPPTGWHNPEQHVYRTGSPTGRRVVFLGDSNLIQYWPRISTLDLREIEVLFIAIPGCPPVRGLTNSGKLECPSMFDILEHWLTPQTSLVVGACWHCYLAPQRDNIVLDGKPISTAADVDRGLAALESYLSELRSRLAHLTLILQIPLDRRFTPKLDRNPFTTSDQLRAAFDAATQPIPRQDAISDIRSLNNQLSSLAKRLEIDAIDPADWICSSSCQIIDGNRFVYLPDGSHLTNSYVRRRATFIDELVVDRH
ncbi:acyltransferase family protein [Rhodopseudomonas sp. BR0G17]|uniref:acyltransferase family protein n=1 Tax=Rhodopseudomonas sp. BR0G17 TaxID=2269368 RepID=UPI0013DE9213|nr:acyltransferase family protein [Rhodopseudomonas sp. BR0G17]NEW95224.1 acyltransferase [Rhodopseudomonas sp. BR0G17]